MPKIRRDSFKITTTSLFSATYFELIYSCVITQRDEPFGLFSIGNYFTTASTSLSMACMPPRLSLIKYQSEEHTSELQSRENLVCRLLLEKKNNTQNRTSDLLASTRSFISLTSTINSRFITWLLYIFQCLFLFVSFIVTLREIHITTEFSSIQNTATTPWRKTDKNNGVNTAGGTGGTQ